MIGFKKIAALIVGASLSVGVGVGISSIDATSEVRAAKGDLLVGGSFVDSFPENGWTSSVEDFYSGNGYKWKSNGQTLSSPTFLSAQTTKITAKIMAGHNGGSGSTLTIAAFSSSNVELDSEVFTPTEAYTKQATLNEFNLDGGDTVISYIKITFSKVNNCGMKQLAVYDNSDDGGQTSDVTGELNFGNDTNRTEINSTNVSAKDSNGFNWLITSTFSGSTSFTQQKTYSQLGSSSKTCTGFNMSMTLPASYKVSNFSIKIGGFNGTAGAVTLKVGDTTVATGNANGENDVTISQANQVEGQTLTIIGDVTPRLKIYGLSYTYLKDDTPSLTLSETELNGFVGGASGSVTATVLNISGTPSFNWVSANENIATVTADGRNATVNYIGEGETTITLTVTSGEITLTGNVSVKVSAVVPSAISTKGSSFNKYVVEGVDSFSSLVENNKVFLTVKYNDDSSAEIVDYSTITLTLGGEPIEKNHVFTNEDSGKQFVIIYTAAGFEPVRSSGVKLNVVLPVDITSLQANFTGGKSYVLVDDDKSTVEFEYFSVFGTPTATVISSNSDIADVSLKTISEPDSETNYGSGTIDVLAYDLGSFYVTLTLNANGHEISINSDLYYVRSSDPASGSDKYVKITSASDLEDGQYLIVCEGKSVAFDGGLSTLDAVGNIITVNPVNGEISASATTKGAEFTYNSTEKSLKSASGKYIGRSSYDNGLDSNTTFGDNFVNTITFSDGNAIITAKGNTTLRYNSTSNQTRFRYYKTGQTSIQLYKFEEGSSTDDETMVIRFIDNYMKFDVVSDTTNKGTGLCETEGWYAKAKDAFFDATATSTESFHLNAAQRALLVGHYSEAWARLQAWATANHEVISVDGVTTLGNQGFNLIKDTNTTVVIAIVVSVTVLAVFAVATIRKRKEI